MPHSTINRLLGSITLVSSIISLPVQSQTIPKKNVLFIAVDDLKPILGCYGNKMIKTPNIDRLAARGTVFTQNYCQQAICGPTRASLMTGKRPDYTQIYDLETLMRDKQPDIVTIPQYFISNGYTSEGIGKIFDPRCVVNLDYPKSWSKPYNTLGDIDYYNGIRPKFAYYHSPTASATNKPATECLDTNIPDHAYNDGATANKAITILKNLKTANNPFFFAVGFSRPHLPFVAPKKYWDLYNRADIPVASFQQKAANAVDIAYHNSGEIRAYTDIPPLASFTDMGIGLPIDKQKELIHGYYASVSYTDAQIGKLLDTLDDLGLTNNTIIVLWGDHGWHLGDHDMWCKHSNFEQAAKAPLIISDPTISSSKSKSPSEFVDVFPTLCDLANLAIPSNLDGKSLKQVMANPNTSVKDYAISQYPRGDKMGYSLRTSKYRLTWWMHDGFKSYYSFDFSKVFAKELYDYQNDSLETINYANNYNYKTILSDLENKMVSFFESQRNTFQSNSLFFYSIPAKYYCSPNFVPETNKPNSLLSFTSSNPSVATVTNGNIIEIKGLGTSTITVIQAASGTLAAASATQILNIKRCNTVITFPEIPIKYFQGESDFNPNITSTSVLNITLTSSNNSVATIVNNTTIRIVGNVGTSTITATQVGDARYAPASSTQLLTVKNNKQTQTITFPPFPKVFLGSADSSWASASSKLPITYSSSNTNVATIVNGKVHVVGIGTAYIMASQTGNLVFYAASETTQLLTVEKEIPDLQLQQIIITNPFIADFTPITTSNSPVSITYSSSNQSVIQIINNKIHITGVGSSVISAIQPETDYFTSKSVSQTIVVNSISQTITFGVFANKKMGDPDFVPNAYSNASLTLSFTSSNTNVATININKIHIVGVGSSTITANQSGNTFYLPAISVSQTLIISDTTSIKPPVTISKVNSYTSKFEIKPNPAFDIIHLKLNQNFSNIIIYNSLGSKVFEKQNVSNNLSIPTIQIGGKGLYFVKIYGETKKLMIVK